jgi:hypothetical protein
MRRVLDRGRIAPSPARIYAAISTSQESWNAGNTMNKLIVRKEGGLFVLRSFRAGQQLETVKAFDAQMIIDYVNATWPVGTKVQWIIVPRSIAEERRNPGKEFFGSRPSFPIPAFQISSAI